MNPSTVFFIFWNLASIVSTSAFVSSSPPKKKHTWCSNRNNDKETATSISSSSNSNNQMDDAKKLINNAIAIGAPAYNSGNVKECAQVYKTTAVEMASMLLPAALLTGLDKAIQSEYGDVNEEAWAFRKQFDGIMEYQIPFMPMSTPSNADTENSDSCLTLEQFTDRMIPSQPVIVNDNVMGGISQGQWDGQTRTFKGTTSLANNGGFSSLRWRMSNVQNWSYATGIYLKVQHSDPEQHTFRLILKDMTCEQVRGANFKNIFSNPIKSDEPILFPFESFDQIEQMGRPMMGPVFNRAAVIELGLMAIKPSVVGYFELKIDEWGLYTV